MVNIFNEIENKEVHDYEVYIRKKIIGFKQRLEFYEKYNEDDDVKKLLFSSIKEINFINYDIITLQEKIVKRIMKSNSYSSIREIKEEEKIPIRTLLKEEKSSLKKIQKNIINIINHEKQNVYINTYKQ
ncbi:MAG: hypothetical protein ACRCUM_01315 [Mycoplasmoidaceae bacterium]